MLYGRPVGRKSTRQADRWDAREIHGHRELGAAAGPRPTTPCGYSGSGPTWIACVIGHAGSPPEGPAIASTDSSTSVNAAVNVARRARAAASRWGDTPAPSARNSRMYGPYSLARDGYRAGMGGHDFCTAEGEPRIDDSARVGHPDVDDLRPVILRQLQRRRDCRRLAAVDPLQRVVSIDAKARALKPTLEFLERASGAGATSDVGSAGSRPAIASSTMATSATLRAIGPT